MRNWRRTVASGGAGRALLAGHNDLQDRIKHWCRDHPRAGIASAGYVAILGFVLACVDVPTAPARLQPLAPRRSVAGPLGSDVPFPIAPFNGPDSLHRGIPLNAEVSDFDTGIRLPDNSTVEIRIRGRIALAQRTDYGGANTSNYATLSGNSYSPWGIPNTVPTGGQNLAVQIASNLNQGPET